MRFASLGSGSEGNALIVEAGNTRLMLDCGMPVRETERRLARLGLAPEDLAGIVVTHEHSDHIDGVLPFARRHRLKTWMTWGSLRGAIGDALPEAEVIVIDSHETFAVGDLEVCPYPVPHDAREPVQYVFSDGAMRLGVLTDAGASTRHIEAMLNGCDALVLECNHDEAMLANGPYPAFLKERIGGPFGHLANHVAAQILAKIDCSRLKHLVAAHLSLRNNRPELARNALAGALGCASDWIQVADQNEGFAWRSLV
ncbi:MAG TPA: MBL fold metallo-hydrolase [Burkholderiales bacterium]|nr:MBL fold metallo-hydrolase [Burkholderiales bacterium]